MSESYSVVCKTAAGLATAVAVVKNYGTSRNIQNWTVSTFGPFDPLTLDKQTITGTTPAYANIYTDGPDAYLVVGCVSGSGPNKV